MTSTVLTFTKLALRFFLAFVSIGPLKRSIKLVIGKGKLYKFTIKIFLKMHQKIQPFLFENTYSSSQLSNKATNRGRRVVFVDVTSQTNLGSKGGIQRTQMKFLENAISVSELEIIPVGSNRKGFYKVFLSEATEEKTFSLIKSGEKVIFEPGDIFLSLDLNYISIISNFNFYRTLAKNGVNLWFVIYDLLPIDYPEYFPVGIPELYESW
jgi:hypothetical protein